MTDAPRPLSQDIAHRERRYLIMMGIRLVCFIVAVLAYVNGAGWYALLPAAGAIFIPYVAVVFANGGREPSKSRGIVGFKPYLPAGSSRPGENGPPPHIVGFVTKPDAPGDPDGSSDPDPSTGQDPSSHQER